MLLENMVNKIVEDMGWDLDVIEEMTEMVKSVPHLDIVGYRLMLSLVFDQYLSDMMKHLLQVSPYSKSEYEGNSTAAKEATVFGFFCDSSVTQ